MRRYIKRRIRFNYEQLNIIKAGKLHLIGGSLGHYYIIPLIKRNFPVFRQKFALAMMYKYKFMLIAVAVKYIGILAYLCCRYYTMIILQEDISCCKEISFSLF